METTDRGKNVTLLKSEITDIVSEIIRLKENLFKDGLFRAYLK